jgi:hypothetical protein
MAVTTTKIQTPSPTIKTEDVKTETESTNKPASTITVKVNADTTNAMEGINALRTQLEGLQAITNQLTSKVEGKYDGGYVADPNKQDDEQPAFTEGKYDGGYVEKDGKDKEEDDVDDSEMCKCDKCGSSYKKSKKVDNVDSTDYAKKEEPAAATASPSATKAMGNFNFGVHSNKPLKPTKEDIAKAKSKPFNVKSFFGLPELESRSLPMTNWAMGEIDKMTPKTK